MELLVLDKNFTPIDILDSFESLIWTDKYCGYGDFEIYTRASKRLLSILKQDNYLQLRDSGRVMVIEEIKLNDDFEDGDTLIVTGRSLESILDRRIVWQQTVLIGGLQNGIQKLLNENVISPLIAERAIPNFIFEPSSDPLIIAIMIDSQMTWVELYEAIRKMCETNNLGFMITLSDEKQLVFKLYSGVDRSYDQMENPYVVFSPDFENLINSGYSESLSTLKTVSLVAGEGEAPEDRITTIIGGGEGLSRREMYTDARDISQDTAEALLSNTEYLAQLAQRGNEDLVEHGLKKNFEGQLDASRMFTYGKDFFLGDIVQVVNEYGVKTKARVSELTHSQSTSGEDIYPKFTIIE